MAELMTLEEVADYLRVTRKTIYRLLKRGDIPATRVGHQWRFEKSRIDDWLRPGEGRATASILVVDDEETIRLLFKATLEELGHRVFTAANGAEGLELVKQQDFHLAFIDLKMPALDGASLLEEITATKPDLPVTIITGYPDSELMARALAQGPFGVMNKPFGENDIIRATKNFLHITEGA